MPEHETIICVLNKTAFRYASKKPQGTEVVEDKNEGVKGFAVRMFFMQFYAMQLELSKQAAGCSPMLVCNYGKSPFIVKKTLFMAYSLIQLLMQTACFSQLPFSIHGNEHFSSDEVLLRSRIAIFMGRVWKCKHFVVVYCNRLKLNDLQYYYNNDNE